MTDVKHNKSSIQPKDVGSQRRNDNRNDASRDVIAHQAIDRPDRVPLSENVLQLDWMIPEGYTGYWEIDRPGKLKAREMAGWEYVLDENGNKIKRTCNNGDELFLMMCLNKWVEEDAQPAKQKRAEMLSQLNMLKSGQYVPQGQQQAVQPQRKVNYI